MIGAILIGGVAWGLWPGSSSIADATDRQQVLLGQNIYQRNCASCHGPKLEGQPSWQIRKSNGRLPAPPHDETGHTWHHPDRDLFKITKDGMRPPVAPEGYESDMPPFSGVLTDREIWAVLAFIKSSWPTRIQRLQGNLNKAAEK